MPKLNCDLVFIDRREDGTEYHRTFPAGTPVEDAPSTRKDGEFAVCRTRCSELARQGDPGCQVMIMDGLPRILHQKYFE